MVLVSINYIIFTNAIENVTRTRTTELQSVDALKIDSNHIFITLIQPLKSFFFDDQIKKSSLILILFLLN